MSTATKLSYLNTTKGKIKDSINITGANITNETTFRNYAVLLKDKLAELLKDPSPIWDNFPKTNATGTDIQVNTYASWFDYLLKGDTYQYTTTGKNLYNLSGGTNVNTTSTINNDTLTLTSTGSWARYEETINVVANQGYTFKVVFSNNTGKVKINLFDGNTDIGGPTSSTSSSGTFTIPFTPQNTTIKIQMYCNFTGDNVSTTITFSQVQLEKGSATSYEPYTNGASPNPSYPQPIQVVSGDNTIGITGKNLFDRANAYVNFALNWGTGANFGETGSLASDFIPTQIGNKYATTYSSQIMYYDKNKKYLGCLQTGGQTIAKTKGNTWKYFTTPNYDEIAYMRLGIRKFSDGGEDKTNKNIMLNREYVLEPYEPYTGQTYSINLGKNLCDIVLDSSIANTILYKQYTLQPNTQYVVSSNTYWQEQNIANVFAGSGTSITPSTSGNGVKGSRVITSDNNGNIIIGYRNYDQHFDYSSGDYYIQIEKGSQATSYSKYFTPIELCKIGTYQDKIFKGKGINLLSSEWEQGNINSTTGVNEGGSNVRRSVDYIKVEPNTTYTISRTISGNTLPIRQYGINHEYIGSQSPMVNYLTTYTTPNNVYYIRFVDWVNNNSNEIMLVKGSYDTSTIPTYEPYNAKDKWLLHKEIGKYVANNDLTSNGTTETSINLLTPVLNIDVSASASYLSVRAKCNLMATILTSATNNTGLNGTTSSGHIRVNISKDYASDYATARTFLTNKGLTIYYVLATPTTEEITNSELVSQLNSIELVDGENNITITGDLAAILNLTVLERE